jgi:hypothetical protein
MRHGFWKALACATLVLGSTRTLTAQGPGVMPGSAAGMNAALTKLFGDVKGFSARTEARILDAAGKENTSLTMRLALLDGKLRTDLDIAQLKSTQMTPGALQSLKALGMDRIVSIVRPDKNVLYLIYPGLESYAEMTIPKDEALSADTDVKLEKTRIGKETIDGQDCVKHKVIIATKTGERQEALVWNATALKDFPIQMQLREKDATVLMRYKDIDLKRPEPALFAPPTAFAKYGDMQELMSAAVKKTLGASGATAAPASPAAPKR